MEDTGVTIAPTRPLGHPKSGRRKPKGPRAMALSHKDEQTLDRIRAASDKLRAVDAPDLADAVDNTLTVEHLAILKRTAWSAKSDNDPNLPIGMWAVRRDLIREKAKVADESLTKVVEDYFRRFLAGEFVPLAEDRPQPGSMGAKVVLNVRPEGELHAKVSAKCRELRESGASPRLFVSTVAAHALYAHYGIGPYAPENTGAE